MWPGSKQRQSDEAAYALSLRPSGGTRAPRPSFPHCSLAVRPAKRDRAPSAILSAAPLWASDTLEFRIDKVFRVSVVSEAVRFLQTIWYQHLMKFSVVGIPRFWTASISILMVIDPETKVGYAWVVAEPDWTRRRTLWAALLSQPDRVAR